MTTEPLVCAATGIAYDVPLAGRRNRIIDIPDLSMKAGEFNVLAGPSGSGKSTLLYLLSGLLIPGEGRVVWGDRNISAETEAERDRWRLDHSGFVFQSFHLIEELSPLDNVLAASWFRGGGNAVRDRAKALLRRFDVPHEAQRVNLLSNGEQQRVALCRALLFDPPIIFADEPTASLDARSGMVVAETLRDLATKDGKTVIVVTHDPAIVSIAHRVIRLDHGRVIAKAADVEAA